MNPDADPNPAAAWSNRIRRIEMLVLDVDGVLTDGRIIIGADGGEIKAFHVRDGIALKYWLAAGKEAAILSGRSAPAVARRAAELGITRVIQGAAGKLAGLRGLLAETGLKPEQVCAVGDDLPDLPLLRNCGVGIAVADACPELRAAARFVTRARGGRGAVREIVEMLLQAQGHWQPLLAGLAGERL